MQSEIKEVKINGYTYYWQDNVLYEDKALTNVVPLNHMTENEKKQLHNQLHYNQ